MITPTAYQLNALRRDQNVGIITEPVDGDFFVGRVYGMTGTLLHTTAQCKNETDADTAAREWIDRNISMTFGITSLA